MQKSGVMLKSLAFLSILIFCNVVWHAVSQTDQTVKIFNRRPATHEIRDADEHETTAFHYVGNYASLVGIASVHSSIFSLASTRLEIVVGFALFLLLIYGVRRYELSRQNFKLQTELQRVEMEKLKELDQLKSDFFANISHELRTPLTLILGPAESLIKHADGVEKEKLRRIRRNARRLLRLVNQILDLSRLESNKLQLRVRRGDFISFLKGLVVSFESWAEQKGIDLVFKENGGRPEGESGALTAHVAYFDRDVMEKIFINLLFNALKFTPSGGSVRISFSPVSQCMLTPIRSTSGKTVELVHPRCELCIRGGKGGPRPDHCVEITVSDTGIGIPRDQLPKIFNRYYQVQGAGRRKHGGAGVGLALVKELVKLHYGSISVSSEEEAGTAFTVCLPIGKAHLRPQEIAEEPDDSQAALEEPAMQHEQPEPGTTPGEGRPPKKGERPLVLIIEDNDDMRAHIREQLEPDYDIVEAADGDEGVEKAIEAIPDLVISDVMMPKKDGYHVCRTLKTDLRTSHIPVILLTAKAGEQERLDGFETGADAYVLKPFRRQELAARVRNLIELRRKLRARYSTATTIKPSEIEAASMDREFLQSVVTKIEKNIEDELFGAEVLARAVGMSLSQLNRKLNALIGQPAGKMIRSMRLQRAADLLMKKAGTVAEICYSTGFSDQANFTRSFKKQFGCSPSEYQKRHGEQLMT